LTGIEKRDGQLEVSKSPALPKSDKERNSNPALTQKVFTMSRIGRSRWPGFGVHGRPVLPRVWWGDCSDRSQEQNQTQSQSGLATWPRKRSWSN